MAKTRRGAKKSVKKGPKKSAKKGTRRGAKKSVRSKGNGGYGGFGQKL